MTVFGTMSVIGTFTLSATWHGNLHRISSIIFLPTFSHAGTRAAAFERLRYRIANRVALERRGVSYRYLQQTLLITPRRYLSQYAKSCRARSRISREFASGKNSRLRSSEFKSWHFRTFACLGDPKNWKTITHRLKFHIVQWWRWTKRFRCLRKIRVRSQRLYKIKYFINDKITFDLVLRFSRFVWVFCVSMLYEWSGPFGENFSSEDSCVNSNLFLVDLRDTILN